MNCVKSVKERVIEVLRNNPDRVFNVSMVADIVGANVKYVAKVLRELAEEGKVSRVVTGGETLVKWKVRG